MRKIIGLVVFAALTLGGGGAWSHGHDVPFPLSDEIPFPWNSIEGTWRAEDSNLGVSFSFAVETSSEGYKVLRVQMVNLAKNRVIAQGAGFVDQGERAVSAVIKGLGHTYIVKVRAFKDDQGQQMTVLTIRPLVPGSTPAAEEDEYLLKKVSRVP
jgi:hypothetical protein